MKHIYYCDQNSISQGIEETYEIVMAELYAKYHVSLRAEPTYYPTLAERLERAFFEQVSKSEGQNEH